MKSAVSILHDYLNKIGINAVYEVRSENVTRRTVLFHYRVRVGDLEATAAGFSKKQGKQYASEKMLDILYQSSKLVKSVFQNQNIHRKCFDDIIKLHPVQSLHNISMANHWYNPTYEYVTQEGPANNRIFTCVSRINNIQEKGIGIGKSKKLSKANAVYNLVKKLFIQNANSFENLVSHSSMNYVTALRDMARSNGLQLNLFHYSDKENYAQKQCLLEVVSNPVIVCCGFGKTQEDASSDASMNAINSLQILVGQYCNK